MSLCNAQFFGSEVGGQDEEWMAVRLPGWLVNGLTFRTRSVSLHQMFGTTVHWNCYVYVIFNCVFFCNFFFLPFWLAEPLHLWVVNQSSAKFIHANTRRRRLFEGFVVDNAWLENQCADRRPPEIDVIIDIEEEQKMPFNRFDHCFDRTRSYFGWLVIQNRVVTQVLLMRVCCSKYGEQHRSTQ